MSFVSRVAVSNSNTLSTFDAAAAVASTYSTDFTLACNNYMVTALTALKGVGGYVQSAGNATSAASFTVTQAFAFNNTAGNCIVVDVVMTWNVIIPYTVTVTDSQGNTYTQVFASAFGLNQTNQFVAFGIAAGANTVTVTMSGSSGTPGAPTVAIHEYSGGTSVDAHTVHQQNGNATVTQTITTTGSGETLHAFGAIVSACPGSPVISPASPSGGNVIPGAWLVINEPGVGYTDRTSYMFKGSGNQNNWTQQARHRGQATIHLRIAGSDSYAPTKGSPIFLFEQTAAGFGGVFSGLIQDINNQYFGNFGDRYIVITAVSFESIFDTVYAEPMQFVNQTCGAIVTALFNAFETGSPISLGLWISR